MRLNILDYLPCFTKANASLTHVYWWTLPLLYVGRVYLSFYGCRVYFVAFILLLLEIPVSKQRRP